jgi:hypothetical protein
LGQVLGWHAGVLFSHWPEQISWGMLLAEIPMHC